MGCLLAVALPGFACEFPDEGATPLRRAVTRVEMLPEVHAWTVDLYEKGAARPPRARRAARKRPRPKSQPSAVLRDRAG